MSKRARELAAAREAFEFAVRNGCDLLEAKRRLANIRRAAAEDAREQRRLCGTMAKTAANTIETAIDRPVDDERWMMRD